MIELKNIDKVYDAKIDDTKVLNNLCLTIGDGEFVAIMGPSGSGKSTLLNIIGCMDQATAGTYILDHHVISQLNKSSIHKIRKEKIGFIFQHFALMDHYTAYENVELPLLAKNISKKKRRQQVHDVMKKLGVDQFANKLPSMMSGGQQQRVAIARALVSECSVILADEPTGALDQKNGQEVLDLLQKINQEGKTVIVVTHDEKVAQRTNRIISICDGMIRMDHKNG